MSGPDLVDDWFAQWFDQLGKDERLEMSRYLSERLGIAEQQEFAAWFDGQPEDERRRVGRHVGEMLTVLKSMLREFGEGSTPEVLLMTLPDGKSSMDSDSGLVDDWFMRWFGKLDACERLDISRYVDERLGLAEREEFGAWFDELPRDERQQVGRHVGEMLVALMSILYGLGEGSTTEFLWMTLPDPLRDIVHVLAADAGQSRPAS